MKTTFKKQAKVVHNIYLKGPSYLKAMKPKDVRALRDAHDTLLSLMFVSNKMLLVTPTLLELAKKIVKDYAKGEACKVEHISKLRELILITKTKF